MTKNPRPVREALERRDVTIALTPGQLLLAVLGLFVLLRILRRRRRG